jgi:dienelactone hydrolase
MDVAALNQMLLNAVRDLASCKPEPSREEHRARAFRQRAELEKLIGLFPQPARNLLYPKVANAAAKDGFRIEQILFESRPGFPVTATLYMPDGVEKPPLIVSTDAGELGDKGAAWVQARGIGLALKGYAAMILDSPGSGERGFAGDPSDSVLVMGVPAAGVYAWDLIRAIDYADVRDDLDISRIAIVGEGTAAAAAAIAFALDDRIRACVLSSWGAGLAAGAPITQCDIPGLVRIGDFGDLLGIRAPAPVLLLGAEGDTDCPTHGLEGTRDKLAEIHGLFGSTTSARLQTTLGGRDFNRRMREAMYGFLDEYVMGVGKAAYAPEPRPLTDGRLNPYPNWTEPEDSPELNFSEAAISGRSLRSLLDEALAQPNPEAYDLEHRLIPWPKHGRLEELEPEEVLLIHDEGLDPEPPGSRYIPLLGLDLKLCHLLGLSGAEFHAQLLHYRLPGRPEGWERRGLTGDALTSIIASVKTLVETSKPPSTFRVLGASGPVSSEIARLLKLYRPWLEITTTDNLLGWPEVASSGDMANYMPSARYLKHPQNAG